MKDPPSILLPPNIVIRSEERIYAPLLGLAMLLDSNVSLIASAAGHPMHRDMGRHYTLRANQHPFHIVFDTGLVVKSLFNNLLPREIKFWGELREPENSSDKTAPRPIRAHKVLSEAVIDVISAVFTKYYETYNPELLQRLTGTVDDRPEMYRFIRTVRNAMVHRGRVSWPKGESFRAPVSWNGLTISKDMHDEVIIGTLINEADLVWLMLEYDGLLGKAGIPHPGAHLVKYITK